MSGARGVLVITARRRYQCDAWRGYRCPTQINPGDVYLKVVAAPWEDGAGEVWEDGRWVRRWRVARFCADCGAKEYPCHHTARKGSETL
jgi:hypothetical protein